MKTEVGGYQDKTTCVGFLTSHLCNAVPHKYNPQVPVPLKILFSGQFCWLPRAAALKALTPTYEAHYTAPIQSGLICKSNQRQATQQPVCASIRAHQTALSPPPPDTVLSVCSARPQKWFHHFLFNSRETSISCSTDIFIGCFFYVINIETLVYQGDAVTELPGQGSIKSQYRYQNPTSPKGKCLTPLSPLTKALEKLDNASPFQGTPRARTPTV